MQALKESLKGDMGRSVTHVFHLAFSGPLLYTEHPHDYAQLTLKLKQVPAELENNAQKRKGTFWLWERSAFSHVGDTTNVDQTTFIWMKNVVDILEELGASLVHVYFTQG